MYLPIIGLRYNASYSRAANEVPAFLLYGVKPRVKFEDNLRELRQQEPETMKRLEKHAIKKRQPILATKWEEDEAREISNSVLPGELVWWNPSNQRKNFSPPIGPLRVEKIIGTNRFEATDVHSGQVHKVAEEHCRLFC